MSRALTKHYQQKNVNIYQSERLLSPGMVGSPGPKTRLCSNLETLTMFTYESQRARLALVGGNSDVLSTPQDPKTPAIFISQSNRSQDKL